MAYCSNCGEKMREGAKFCKNCGVAADVEGTNESEKRKNEYVGTVRKCPSCGMGIQSFIGICPGCGHEFNSTQVAESFKTFISKLEECDRLIANSPKSTYPKMGWSSWSKPKRTWWVILNVFTLCIPLVIYFALPNFKYNNTPNISPEEKKKVSLIDNYAFSNDRETILEAMLFIKSKTDDILYEKLSHNTAYWMKVWIRKASIIHEKSEILFKGDNVANKAYEGVIENKKKIEKNIKLREIMGVGIIVTFIIFIAIIYITGPSESEREKYKSGANGYIVERH